MGRVPDILTLTLAELSELTELPERTLRLYRTKGLLDPPNVRGRVGYYGDLHVRQLRIVKAMTARGFPLAQIAQLTSSGLSRTALMLLLDAGGQEDLGTAAAMDTILGEISIDRVMAHHPDAIPRLLELGVLHRDVDGRIRVDSLGLAIVSDLTRVGLEMEEVAEFATAVAELGALARREVESRMHPTMPDEQVETALIDAATAVFRETLRNARRR